MAFRTIEVVLTANSAPLRAQLLGAARDVDRFGASAGAAGATASSSAQLMSAAWKAGTVAIVAGAAAAVKAASAFETRMRNVNSISGLSEQALRSLGDEVLDLSRQLPQSANTLAEGLYDIASSGFQGAEGLTVLKASAEAASAGLSNTATSAKAITAVLNAYGLTADDAADVSDVLFQTVNLGVVSFDELAASVGDVVGLGAQAGVSIDQIGSALAAMTLSGISAAESSTSLNRLLQELIKPSDALALALRQLGYESGTQALATDGLHTVMERLRVATGGNVEAFLRLFPEIRAARGALALAAREGENYNRTAAGIEDANARAGATSRALAEQMKALGAQLTLFGNRAKAAAIEAGTRLIPVVLDLANAVQRLGAGAMPTLQHAMAALAPFFRNVVQIGGDLLDVAKDLVETFSPLGKAIAGIAAGTVITALNSLSSILATISGFLADHPGLVTALAVAYGVKLAMSVAQAATAFVSLKLGQVALATDQLSAAVGTAALRYGTLRTAIAGVGLGALVVGIAAVMSAFDNANKRARELVGTVTEGVDRTTYASLSAAVEELGHLRQAQIDTGDSSSSMGNALKGVVQVLTPMENKALDAQRAVDALNSSMAELDQLSGNRARNISNVLVGLKIPDGTYESWERLRPGVEQIAKKLGVDLNQGGKAGEAAVAAVVGAMRDLQVETGVTSAQLAKGFDLAELEALQAGLDEISVKVADAFAGATDFIAAFKPDAAEQTAKAVEQAADSLVDAKDRLADLQAQRAGRKPEDSAEILRDEREIEKAKRRVAEAEGAVRKAESERVGDGGSQIARFYAEQIAATSRFADDLLTAAERGLDPEVLRRLVVSGPEQAGPVLQALVGDHSGRLIAMVNESETKLREINARVVEFARLTERAVRAETDQMSRDLPAAVKIAAENMKQAAEATPDTIAKALGVPTAEVLRVATEFGITIAGAIGSALNGRTAEEIAKMRAQYESFNVANPGAVGPTAFGPVGTTTTTARSRGSYHSGGFIAAPAGSDVPIVAQAGEYVIRAAAVRSIGVNALNGLNRYHQGGYVAAPRAMPSVSASTAPAIDYDRMAQAMVRAGAGARSSTRQYNFGGIHGLSFEQAMERAERQAALASLNGDGA